MKIIFISPFNPLWSDQVTELASLLDAGVMSIGDLLRSEVKKQSSLGEKLSDVLKSGEIVDSELSSELVVDAFFRESSTTILTGFPINRSQVESLSTKIKSNQQKLNAVVVVNISKDQLTTKFRSNSYDLANDKVSYLIDSFYKDGSGVLAASKELASKTGAKYISFTSPAEVIGQLDGNI